MTDRELLELAAKAAGLRIEGDADKLVVFPGRFAGGFSIFNESGGSSLWNPLTDDGDALRLAVKLNMGISIPVMAAKYARVDVITFRNSGVNVMEICNNDPYAATRRAIVRAAAEIGRSMK